MKVHSKRLILLLLVLCLALPAAAQGFRPVRSDHAMVASVRPLASQIGVETMKAGGNAVDAAVAVGFALAVVYPQAGNLGGGGFMLVRFANGDSHFLDFREKAPAAATAKMYLDPAGNVVPDLSLVGYKAIGVPGSVAGLVEAQKRWGKLPLARLMQPAIRLAHDGFALNWADVDEINTETHLGDFPESRRIFLRNGNPYKPGEVLRQPELARTLERIAADPASFYKGTLAQELAAGVQKGGGLLTAKDLADYEVKDRRPVRGTYRGYEVLSAPPPSSGGIALIEALNILEGYDLAKLGDRSAESMHLTVEAFRRAMYDRADFLGDPDFSAIPVAQLIDKRYAEAWRESINPDRASVSKELQRPTGKFNDLDRVSELMPPIASRQALREPDQTTHFSVVDAAGNAVSLTTTLNDTFGSRATAPGLGFLLNDEMDDFASKQGVPNGYGLIQGPANAIGPGKRPLSAMTPTIVLKDGKLYLVLGSPGGPRIITTVANVLMGVVDYGLNIQEAVNARLFHHQWLPDHIVVENAGFSPDTLNMLRKMGHTIDDSTQFWTDAECIAIDLKTGERLGASDARNPGKAIGY